MCLDLRITLIQDLLEGVKVTQHLLVVVRQWKTKQEKFSEWKKREQKMGCSSLHEAQPYPTSVRDWIWLAGWICRDLQD